jgi:hypothetical protein
MTKKYKILIIEDNPNTKRFLEAMLGREFEILAADNGVLGVEYAREQSPDLIVLDVVLPILSGYDACSLLKQDHRTKQIPIIFLSSKNTRTHTSAGLAYGADDYLPKPFDYKELLARIRARLTKPIQQTTPLKIADELMIDPTSREVIYQGKKTHLTLTEFDILKLLAERQGDIVSRDEILKNVWRDESILTNDRTIDVHIRALRKKMPSLSKNIHAVYGVGYKLESDSKPKLN